jgi:PKD repeat protein
MSRVLRSVLSTSLTVSFLFILIIQFTLPATSDGGVGFHADVTSGHAPLTVHFYDDTLGAKSRWVWSFGGEGGSTAKDPPYTFNNPGTYDISLTIYNGSGGVMGTEVKQGYITVYESLPALPVAEFLVNTTQGDAPLYVQFTGLASGGTISYDWDFGDGTQHSAEQSPLHVYTKPANYTARLKVTNPGGTDIKETLISVAAPLVIVNNSTQAITGTLTPTPGPTVVPPTATPGSFIPSVSLPSISLSGDILQLILAALAAIVIAGAIIYYFTHLSKSDNSREKPARNLMRKPRSPVKPRRAPAAKQPAKTPEGPKQQPKPATVQAPAAKPPMKATEAPKPQPKPAPAVQPPVKAPEVPKQPAKAPEVPKPQPKPEIKPAPVAQPPVKAPEKPAPVVKPPVKATEAPKPQPKPESTPAPAAQPPVKAPEKPAKEPAPAQKPIIKGSDLDPDYIYDLVLGRDSEGQKDGAKK